MNQTSKFHIINVYAWLSFLLITTGWTLYFIIRSIVLQINYDSNFSAASVSLVVLIMTGFGLFKLIRNAIMLRITSDTITTEQIFKKEKISQKEIQEIDLFARMDTDAFSNRTRINGISILLKNQKQLFFPDFYYQNSPALKDALLQNFRNYIKYENQYSNTTNESISSYNLQPKTFSGNFIFSFNGALAVLPFIICLTVFKSEKSELFWIIMSLYCLFFFVLISFRAYYFIIQDNALEVKNQIWWWKKSIYDISKIKNLIIQKGNRNSVSLQINTIDFHSYKYQAGSLRDKTWQSFIAECKARKIEVYNEAFV